jgi:hypothetical protein
MSDWISTIKKLDGMAAVNLAEPSPGDLARVAKAYHELQFAYEALQKSNPDAWNNVWLREKIEILTKERDEMGAELAKWKKDAFQFSEHLAAKSAKLVEALKQIDLEWCQHPGMPKIDDHRQWCSACTEWIYPNECNPAAQALAEYESTQEHRK